MRRYSQFGREALGTPIQKHWHPDGGYGFFIRPSSVAVQQRIQYMDNTRSSMIYRDQSYSKSSGFSSIGSCRVGSVSLKRIRKLQVVGSIPIAGSSITSGCMAVSPRGAPVAPILLPLSHSLSRSTTLSYIRSRKAVLSVLSALSIYSPVIR